MLVAEATWSPVVQLPYTLFTWRNWFGFTVRASRVLLCGCECAALASVCCDSDCTAAVPVRSCLRVWLLYWYGAELHSGVPGAGFQHEYDAVARIMLLRIIYLYFC